MADLREIQRAVHKCAVDIIGLRQHLDSGGWWLPCSELAIVRHAAVLAKARYGCMSWTHEDGWMAEVDDDADTWAKVDPDPHRAAVGLLARVMGVAL